MMDMKEKVDFQTSSSHLPFFYHYSSYLPSHVSLHISVVSSNDIFCFKFCSHLLTEDMDQIKSNTGLLSTIMLWITVAGPNTENVRQPTHMSSPINAGFPLVYISSAQWFQWVHTVFYKALPPCQEKCPVVNKHRTRACKCWLLPWCRLQWLLWQVTIILLVESKYIARLTSNTNSIDQFFINDWAPLCHKCRECIDTQPSYNH